MFLIFFFRISFVGFHSKLNISARLYAFCEVVFGTLYVFFFFNLIPRVSSQYKQLRHVYCEIVWFEAISLSSKVMCLRGKL